MTGGDRITARKMRGDFFEFEPQFTLLIAGNHKPILRSVDQAIRRRIHLIPFAVSIRTEEKDPELPARLKAEWPGILHWMIKGCLAWQAGGLKPPAAVREATERYLDDQDGIAAWLAENCDRESGAWEKRASLFKSYRAWCERNGEQPLARADLFADLEAKGFHAARRNTGDGYLGLCVRREDEFSSRWDR